MSIDLEAIRSRHAIEQIVNEHVPLGNRWIGVEPAEHAGACRIRSRDYIKRHRLQDA